MKIAPVIMACAERSAFVQELLASMDAPTTVVWDEKRDRYDTGRRALLAGAAVEGATHVLCLQDDALVCRDLVASLHKAVEVVPDNPLCLYFGYGRNGAHQRTNQLAARSPVPSLLVFEGPWWGVAVVFPVKLIEKMLQRSDAKQASPAYDKRLSRALQRLKVDTYYVLPSLVDHRLDGPSMVEGRDQDGRHAHHFIGTGASALEVDWASLPVLDGHARFHAQRRLHPYVKPDPLPVPRLPRPGPKDVSVSVAVMAHPKREELVPSILEALDAPAEVVWDRHNDRWDTGRRAWLACDPEASHGLVIQDDALVAPDLVAGLTEALKVVGDNPVGLYVGTVRPATQFMAAMIAHSDACGASWVVGEGPWWGVGVALPTHMIQPMLQWCDANPKTEAYDRRMANYFQQAGIACWYTMPSLVDHRQGIPSLIKGRGVTSRKARRFIDGSALAVDWSKLPQHAGRQFVTYSGAAGRRFYACLHCTFFTPMVHSIRSHVRACPEARSGGVERVESVL